MSQSSHKQDGDCHDFFVVLGSNPALSLLELCAVCKAHDPHWEIFRVWREGVMFRSSFFSDEIFERLGGSIKYGQLTDYQCHTKAELVSALGSFFEERFSRAPENEARKKIFFGLSVYPIVAHTVFGPRDLKEVGIAVKRKLRAHGYSVRFVESRERALSSVVVRTNKLLTPSGCEAVVIKDTDGWHIGYTQGVQAFAEFSARDYGRPGRDAASGMLPPKVARMMINMAGIGTSDDNALLRNSASPTRVGEPDMTALDRRTSASGHVLPQTGARARIVSPVPVEEGKEDTYGHYATILDPFCGSGTVLQEALLMGYQSIGSDMSEKAVTDTRKNIEWLIGSGSYKLSANSYKLLHCNVRELSKYIQEPVDAIVTEPYLGPQKEKDLRDIPQVFDELESLYGGAFREFAKVLKPGGRVVFIFPFFALGRGKPTFMSDQLLYDIERVGFQRIHLKNQAMSFYCDRNKIALENFKDFNARGSVLYRRPDQRVGREIFVFKRQTGSA